jgi:hypothetical protein
MIEGFRRLWPMAPERKGFPVFRPGAENPGQRYADVNTRTKKQEKESAFTFMISRIRHKNKPAQN